ncbi:MAG: STAS domain-containing protein [Candidatus Dormiibacterota bacterium]
MTGVSSHDAATPRHLRIDRQLDANGIILALTGELDLASAPELDRQLRELEAANPGRLLIDLSALEFMDSTGIALLVRARQAARTNGHQLALRRGPAQIQRLFALTRLTDHFTFED